MTILRGASFVFIFVFSTLILSAVPLAAVDVQDTRLLSEPDIHGDHVAFTYAGDLWIANNATGDLKGRTDSRGLARRLTSHGGGERSPRFSPDGQWIAFSAEYDGNVDVYVIAAEGGVPRRLTWHPASDVVLDFTPDGQAVLFRSGRASHTRRYHQLHTVPLTGGMPEQLPIPNAFKAAYSPDGRKIAYLPLREPFRQWKNYRGGTHSRIWIYDVADHSVVQIPQPEGRCNDTDPMWIGDNIYFLSDRQGEFNLFVYEAASGQVSRQTKHADFPILNAASDGQRVVYDQAGFLHLFEPTSATTHKLTLSATADLIETRPRYVSGWRYLRGIHLSPSGARAVVELRGEILTVPAKKGDPRNLTQTPDANERDPAWSPDGRRIAYFSDASGEYQLHVTDQSGKGETRAYPLGGSGFYYDPQWSPDSEKLSYIDSSRTLFWIDLASGDIQRISQDVLFGPIGTVRHTWSPDSRWIAHTRNTESNFGQIYLYQLADGRSELITDGLSDTSEPAFDASGKYLYFLASTDAGPRRAWFALSNNDMEVNHHLYLAVLQKGVPSPLAREQDEEKIEDEESENPKAEDKDQEKDEDKDKTLVEVDFDGLDQRILAIPVPAGAFTRLTTGDAGQIYYLRGEPEPGVFGFPTTSLFHYDLNKRQESTLLADTVAFEISADHSKILARRSRDLVLGGSSAPIDAGDGKLAINDIQLHIDPAAEWRQIFDEAWRINRDFFYDPGTHGVDWPAMREKYAPLIEHATSRDDVNRIISWMCSELAVGHHRNGGGDRRATADRIPGGLLGADYEVDQGRYRFKKVYGGLNWNPDLRSPLTEPGIDVAEGEYLLAVEGQELRVPDNLHRHFETTAGRSVEITVGPKPDGRGSRTVKVVPLNGENALRNRDWVEGNLKRVHEATDGRVAYVHVPDTGGTGHIYFKRYFFPQAHKDAIIVDERYNGGGFFADYYIDILRRPYISHWAMRHGADLKTPLASIQGPKVMLIDETAGSGGDMLPWMFSQLEIGTLIGKRTWGGLVGVFGFPELMDGGFITAPNFAIWTEDGFIIENVGVPPDIEVEQWPADVIEGRDPQLEKAIAVILEELEKNPPEKRQRPPYPIRVWQSSDE